MLKTVPRSENSSDRDSKRYYSIANQLGIPELVCDENGEPIKTPS